MARASTDDEVRGGERPIQLGPPASGSPPASPEPVDVICHRRRPGRSFATAALVVAGFALVASMATNPNFRWPVAFRYLFAPQILRGLEWTVLLTVLSMALAIALAVVLVLMRQSDSALARRSAWLWIWFFRGTPVYTQLVFWGLLSVLYPHLTLGVPFGPTFIDVQTRDLLTPIAAAVLGLACNESAYLAEIFRAGFDAVDHGQTEAAQALGLHGLKLQFRITMPQAMRIIVPPTGNEAIGMLKTTSLVLAVPFTLDLNYSANAIANRLYMPIPLLLVSGFWYLAVTSLLMVGQSFLERHFGRGVDRPNVVGGRRT